MTGADYRRQMTELGLDEDLGDLAIDLPRGSSCDLMQSIEDGVQRDIAADCGVQGVKFSRLAWC